MRHPKATDWEKRLKRVFDEIDAELEYRYGDLYPLHPARPARGQTANPEADGLFDVGAAFSPGFGSQTGPGYVVQVRMATLNHVPNEVYERIQNEVVKLLEEKLPQAFPARALRVSRDGDVFKIHGDLSLGEV